MLSLVLTSIMMPTLYSIRYQLANLSCRVQKVIIIISNILTMVERTNPNSGINPVGNKERFLNEMPRLLDTMNEISELMVLNSEEDLSSTDSPSHWSYPHMPYIK